jgi:hypothetical protein
MQYSPKNLRVFARRDSGSHRGRINIAWVLTVVGCFAALLYAAPAEAQATRTWVSGVGDDANPCSRTAPCKTFAGAISKTAPGGLDPGGFGAVTITKSIIISCETGTAGVLTSGTNGIVVSVQAADRVYLRGLDFEGLGTSLSGILFVGLGALHVEKCLIRGYNQGINVATTGGSALYVSDTVIADNNRQLGGGIVIAPSSGGTNVNVERVQLTNNFRGVLASPATGVGPVNVAITNSVASNHVDVGFGALSAGGSVIMFINGSTATLNAIGVESNGAPAQVLIGGSLVSLNSTGAAIIGGARMFSYKNNQINGNTTDGTPITAVGLN